MIFCYRPNLYLEVCVKGVNVLDDLKSLMTVKSVKYVLLLSVFLVFLISYNY